MSYGDEIEVKDEEIDDFECPHCNKKEEAIVMRSYTGFHSRETLLHCSNCDGLYIVVHKFSHIIKLNKEEIKKS